MFLLIKAHGICCYGNAIAELQEQQSQSLASLAEFVGVLAKARPPSRRSGSHALNLGPPVAQRHEFTQRDRRRE